MSAYNIVAQCVCYLITNIHTGPQRDMLERSGFYDAISPDTLFLSIEDAVQTAGKLEHRTTGGYPVSDTSKALSLAVHDADADIVETTQGGAGHRTWHLGVRAKSNVSAEPAPHHQV
jgi:hypothetical protein